MPDVNLVKKALREQFAQLVGVQRCVLAQSSVAADPVRDVDLFIYLWSGIVIHVHLIDEPLKTNKVRRIIENGTNHGIPILFILSGSLLPAHGVRTEVDKWFLPFQALTNEHLYAYQVQDNNVVIFPVQFKPVTRFEVMTDYGAVIAVQQIRHFKQTVKHNALKGYWLLAELAGAASNYSSFQRPSYNTFQPPNGTAKEMPRTAETSGFSSTTKTRLDLCYEMLGVKREANRDEVRAAFRKLAFEVHPDVSDLPKKEAEARFKLLSEAYEYIKSANQW